MTKEEREKVIDALKISAPIHALTEEEFNDYIQTLNKAMDWLEQEPKTGHWEYVQYDYNPKIGNWHCSECRCVVVECVNKEEEGGIPLYKYCPQCGAKMIEPQEREDKECAKKNFQ